MDDRPHGGPDFNNESKATYNPESASHGSGMFSGSQNFTVTGQNFTNITNHYAASVPSDFRIIPLGDIDLRREISVHRDTGVVARQREGTCVRRIYSAKVEGRKSQVTVAIYQGNSAEEEWRRDIANHMSIRHPNIIQIYGAASSGNIHAMLYHDELVPLQEFVDGYRKSHFATVYTYACCGWDLYAVDDHIYSTFQRTLKWNNFTAWIRRSSGRLCAELIPPCNYSPFFFSLRPEGALSISQGIYASSVSNMEVMVAETLTKEEYHRICFVNLSRNRYISTSISMAVKPGAIIACSLHYPLEDPVEIAVLPNENSPFIYNWESSEEAAGVVMEDGWRRFNSDDVLNNSIWLLIGTRYYEPWLSQANHIFRHLRITSNFGNYVFVTAAHFELNILASTESPPAGFLFLCPPQNFETGSSSFRWPVCPAYWSLDPSGAGRLTLEEATRLGFPDLDCTTEIYGYYWDTNVYEGLRKFHRAKGFDPDTQDVARHLGHPLYQLSSESTSQFARVNEGDLEVAEEEYWDTEDGDEPDNLKTETSASEHVNGDAEVSSSSLEADGYDCAESVRTECGSASRSAEDSNSETQAPGSSSVAEGKSDPHTPHAEMVVISGTFKFLINVQLALVLFLGLSWLYK